MHHLPDSRGIKLLLYYVLTWRSVEKPKEKKIQENSLVSLSVWRFPYWLAVPSERGGKYSSMV
jgi:hypothetical protein